MKLYVMGTRGTYPSVLSEESIYGGHTACYVLVLANDIIIFDCGSGLGGIKQILDKNNQKKIHIFLSHYHYDHLVGLLSLQALFDSEANLIFYGGMYNHLGIKDIITQFFAPPFWPVGIKDFSCKLAFVDLQHRQSCWISPDTRVDAIALNHTNPTLGYRVQIGEKRLVYLMDYEHVEPLDVEMLSFIQGADVLIYDATYSTEEYELKRKGWGHSTWQMAVEIAERASVGQLILGHNNPEHTDKQLLLIENQAKEKFPNTFIGKEGMTYCYE